VFVVALANTCFFFLTFLPLFKKNVEHGKEENFYSKRAYSSLGPHTLKSYTPKKRKGPQKKKKKKEKKEEKVFCKV
jgi:hypothetical protein